MIYFIQNAATLNIKIGWTGTEDVGPRLRELQTGSDAPHILLTTCPGSKEAEHELHKRFAGAWVMGEWFRPVPELLQLLISKAALSLASEVLAETTDALHSRQQREQAIESRRESAIALLAEIRRFSGHVVKLHTACGTPHAVVVLNAADPNCESIRRRLRGLEREMGELLAREQEANW